MELSTEQEFVQVMETCRSLFAHKLHDYGAAWRLLRIPSLTDQLLIKARRIRSLEEKGMKALCPNLLVWSIILSSGSFKSNWGIRLMKT